MRVRHLVVAAAVVAGAGSCKTNQQKPVAPAQDEAFEVTPSGDSSEVTRAPAEAAPKIQVVAALSGLEDLLAAASDVARRVSDEPATDPLADMQAAFLQMGFAPAFLDNVDLDNQHAFAVELPTTEPASPADISLAGTIAVIDTRKLIDAIPAPMRPQPLGNGVWEFQQNGNRLLLKEAGKELQIGLSTSDLERASGLRKEVGTGRRIRARAWNIPTDQFDPGTLLGLPSDLPLTKNLSKVIREAETVEIEADFGTKRDLEALARATAPFSELGIEPLGKPRAVATPLEQALPADPVMVTTMSWGDPKLVHKMIDKGVPLDQVPGPFAEIAKKAISGTHGVLDAIADDVVFALYVDKKGRTTVVLAASVKDDAKTMKALRSIHESIVGAVEAHATMQGKNANAKFGVDYKPDGLKFKGTKADRLTITVAKDFRDDLGPVSTFVVKDKFDAVALSNNGIAVLAAGPNAKSIAGDVAGSIGKARKNSLGTNGSLGKLREAMGGCQICIAFDGPDYLAYRLHLLEAEDDDKAVIKDAKKALGKISKVGEVGDAAFGVKVDPKQATAALVLPESLMFAPKETMRVLIGTNNFVDFPSEGFTTEPKTFGVGGVEKPQ
jgi:hypothetical protein